MEKLKEKKEDTGLLVVENKNAIAQKRKEHKILKVIIDILFKISKLFFKLTVLVIIYSVIFSITVYYSNQFMVDKLRESEANKKVDPVLEALRKDKETEKDKEDEDEDEKDKEESDKGEEKKDEKEDREENKEKEEKKKKSNKKKDD